MKIHTLDQITALLRRFTSPASVKSQPVRKKRAGPEMMRNSSARAEDRNPFRYSVTKVRRHIRRIQMHRGARRKNSFRVRKRNTNAMMGMTAPMTAWKFKPPNALNHQSWSMAGLRKIIPRRVALGAYDRVTAMQTTKIRPIIMNMLQLKSACRKKRKNHSATA